MATPNILTAIASVTGAFIEHSKYNTKAVLENQAYHKFFETIQDAYTNKIDWWEDEVGQALHTLTEKLREIRQNNV